MGTQPTAEDPRSFNRFSAHRDSDIDTRDNSWEGTSSESDTESLPDPEFRVEERRTVPAVEFSLRGDHRAAFESLDEFDLNSIFEGRANVMSISFSDERGCSCSQSE